MNILNKVYFTKGFLLFSLLIILTGLFRQFTVFFLLIFIHEVGHFLTAYILKEQVDKIYFYPYGGHSKIKSDLNIPLKKELLILIMGPIFQIIGYYILKVFIDYSYLKTYHYALLFFNLLPIYPLDGGKLIGILLNYKFNYLNSYRILIIISFFFLLILFVFTIFFLKNLNLALILFFLLVKIIELIKNLNFYYLKFLMERHLNNYKFKKIKVIKNIKSFYRDKKHVINNETEKNFLRKYFKK